MNQYSFFINPILAKWQKIIPFAGLKRNFVKIRQREQKYFDNLSKNISEISFPSILVRNHSLKKRTKAKKLRFFLRSDILQKKAML